MSVWQALHRRGDRSADSPACSGVISPASSASLTGLDFFAILAVFIFASVPCLVVNVRPVESSLATLQVTIFDRIRSTKVCGTLQALEIWLLDHWHHSASANMASTALYLSALVQRWPRLLFVLNEYSAANRICCFDSAVFDC